MALNTLHDLVCIFLIIFYNCFHELISFIHYFLCHCAWLDPIIKLNTSFTKYITKFYHYCHQAEVFNKCQLQRREMIHPTTKKKYLKLFVRWWIRPKLMVVVCFLMFCTFECRMQSWFIIFNNNTIVLKIKMIWFKWAKLSVQFISNVNKCVNLLKTYFQDMLFYYFCCI